MIRQTLHVLVLGLIAISQLLQASSICANITTLEPDDQPLRHAGLTVTSLLDPAIHFVASADKDGNACVNHLPEGLYSVEASCVGHMNARYYLVSVVFPKDVNLRFRLPFGEIYEGGLASEATVSGTLLKVYRLAQDSVFCLFEKRQGLNTRGVYDNE
jgi:hypothetical protein